MSTYSINPNKKFTIEIMILLLFLTFGTAGTMKAQDFTVTVSASPSAGGSVSHTGGTWGGNTGTYTSGETATLTATPNAGWIFDKWIDGVGATFSNYTTCSVTSDADLTALFAPISIGSATEWGYFCDAIANGCKYSNKTVTLTNNITITGWRANSTTPVVPTAHHSFTPPSPINLLITSVLSFIRTIVILKKSLPGYAMAQNRFI